MTEEYTIGELEKKIGYQFRDKSLLKQALTHSSFANEQRINKLKDYERLEFLGDSVLGFVTAEYLFARHPDSPEGELTRIRAALVCEESLHEVADAYPVDKLLTAGDPAYLQAHYEEMYAPFTQTLSGMFSADWYFEYTAPGIDKARALEGALPKLGIDASEVVSFGDGQNDKSIIEWAGTGVAMGNAVDEVKAVAQMVTANNNEDGIAVALDKLLG